MTSIPLNDRYPGAQQLQPSNNKWPGHQGRNAVVIHIAEGSFQSSIDWMAKNGTSCHFIISETGIVAQLVSVEDSAWCNGATHKNGAWVCPHGKIVKPTWRHIVPGINPNWQTISIELAGYSGHPMSGAQRAALLDLLTWLADRFPQLPPYIVGSTLIGHYHIDPIDKARCPGIGVNLEALATEVNARLAAEEPRWVRAWQAAGVQLPSEQRNWKIPQTYKEHHEVLGACVRPEEYLTDKVSVAVFVRGSITYYAPTQRAIVTLF
jgi:N-acetyl-anhydromuramyl-L-alanine amidase AmpD